MKRNPSLDGIDEVAAFDFLSHGGMHHAFNEGFVRILRAAFPARRIRLFACAPHIEQLKARLPDAGDLEFEACPLLRAPFGLSIRNPLAGAWAARTCVAFMHRALAGRPIRYVAVLGIDANLFAAVSHARAVRGMTPLDVVLHGELGDAMTWRSRNPLIRAGDFVARLNRRLPEGVRLVVPELGIKESIGAIAPALSPAIETLEHPILVSEWSEAQDFSSGRIRVGFLGQARLAKGFGHFVELAQKGNRAELEFHAIGLGTADSQRMDLTALSRAPAQEQLARAQYIAAVRSIDLLCNPLDSRAYEFTPSGTLMDAIAALKPVIALRGRVMDAILGKYGEIGYVAESLEEMSDLVANFARQDFERRRPGWVHNLRRIREARRPDALSAKFPWPPAAREPFDG